MPFAVIDFGASCHTDVHVILTKLHQGNAILQGQNKPVFSTFGVSIENYTLGVKRPYLKGWLDAAEFKVYPSEQGYKYRIEK